MKKIMIGGIMMHGKTASAGLSLSVKRALGLKTCHKKGEIYSLSLGSESEEAEFHSRLEEIQGEFFGDDEVCNRIDSLISNDTKRDWYHCESQYVSLMTEEAAYQKALASFFMGKNRVASNIPWSLPVSYETGNVRVEKLYGKVHAVYEEKGKHIAVVFCRRSDYSMRAYKFSNKLENAPELLGAYLSLRDTYGEDLQMVLAHTRPKKKLPEGCFFDKAQVMSVSFAGKTTDELMQNLVRILTEQEKKPDCTTCLYCSLCSGMNVPKKKSAEQTVVKKKEPKFTAAQQKLVDFKEGACAVYAVPGAGKTTSLVYRLKTLLDSGVDPKSILFVTFTNKACEEIRSRVQALLQTDFEEQLPDIFTYNGLGWQILRDNQDIVGELKLLSSIDEKLLLMECIDRLREEKEELPSTFNFNYIEGTRGLLSELLSCFRKLDDLIKAEEERDRLVAKGQLEAVLYLKKALANRIADQGYITFDEQITLASRLLSENPSILKGYGDRWQYIMADEFQDSSADNVGLLYSLAEAGKRNLVVVGDADQSIYEWRDASPEHLINFQKSFPEATMIQMSDNFRSGQRIIDAANRLIKRNVKRIKMKIVPHKESDSRPFRVINSSLNDVMRIVRELESRHYRYGDIAILSRNNTALGKVKELLSENGIESSSPTDLLIRDVFFVLLKDILDLYCNGFTLATDMAFFRYLLACGVNPPMKQNHCETLHDHVVNSFDLAPINIYDMDSMLVYESMDMDRAEDGIYVSLRRLYLLFLFINENRNSPHSVLQEVVTVFGADQDMPSVAEMKRVIDFEGIESVTDLCNYMNLMAELLDDRKIEHSPSPDKVNLMTAHGSKGKEFPAVIILQTEDFGQTEEEIRLYYVAMTRAEKTLFAMETLGKGAEMLSDITDAFQTVSFS